MNGANVSFALSKEKARSEYMRCAVDPVYFFKTYCVIQDIGKGKINFNLYPYQERVLMDLLKHKYNIILKSRQLGISTLCSAYALWLMLFNDDTFVLVVAMDRNTARQMVTKVKIMHEHLPIWLKFDSKKMEENNKLSLRFPNGSQIEAISSDPDAARGRAASLLIIDEAAFIESAEELWTGAYPTLSKSGGRAIILSSPNGVGGFFYNMWQKADPSLGEEYNLFNRIFLPWNVHPERDEKWLAEQEKTLGKRRSLQEIHAKFLGSGDTLIEMDKILEHEKKNKMSPVEKRMNSLWIFKHCVPGKNYIVSADSARGDGTDYSAFHVIDVEECEQVAEFKGKIDVQNFANILVNIANEYNGAHLVVENNGTGNAVLQEIFNRGYKNVYHTRSNATIYNINEELSKGLDVANRNSVPGFTTSLKTRPLVIAKLEEYMRLDQVIIRSERTYDELKTFVWINGKVQAQHGCNDDLCMSLAIGLFARDTNLKLIEEGIKFQKTLLENMRFSNENAQKIDENPWKISVNGVTEDITWLLK